MSPGSIPESPFEPPVGEERIHDEESFPLSRFRIRFKLLFIYSALLILSTALMIYLATDYFTESMQERVQENNITLAEEVGARTRGRIENLILGARQALRSAAGRGEFFANHPDVLMIGRMGAGGALRGAHWNRDFLDDYRLQSGEALAAYDRQRDLFAQSLSGAEVVGNISPGMSRPLLGVSAPFPGGGLIVLVGVEGFLEPFATDANELRLTQLMMVDGAGRIVGHPERARVMAAEDVSDLPIVRALLESPVDLGQTIYRDEEGRRWLGSYRKLGFAGLGVIAAAPADRAFEAVSLIQRNNILILIIVLNVALLIMFFYARNITLPVKRLVAAVQRVRRGDYVVDLEPAARDEIGLLTHSMTAMARGLDEREKIKKAFGQFVNPEIAERVLRGDIQLGGEEKRCAIFFSDLRGFTAMSEKMSAAEVVEYLNQYFREMVNCVYLTNGVVDKFIGDAVMAHWGAFYSEGNDTENAVNTALLMRELLIEFNKTAGTVTRPFTRFGCGINTGTVIAGQIGSVEKLDFTVIGDAVNLASRIETLNKPLGTDILISEESYQEVKDLFVVEKMPAIKVKGKEQAQNIYAVIRRVDFDEPADLAEVRRLCGIQPPAPAESVDLNKSEDKFEVLE